MSKVFTKRLEFRRRGRKTWQKCQGETWAALETLRNPKVLLERARQAAPRQYEFRIV